MRGSNSVRSVRDVVEKREKDERGDEDDRRLQVVAVVMGDRQVKSQKDRPIVKRDVETVPSLKMLGQEERSSSMTAMMKRKKNIGKIIVPQYPSVREHLLVRPNTLRREWGVQPV